MRSRYLIFSLYILCFHSLVQGEEFDLLCQAVVKPEERNILLSTSDLEFKIKNPRRACDSDFTYESIALPGKKWMISSWPTDEELGLNAQRDLFIAPSKRSEAIYIGSMPVDATAITANTYRSVRQLGGSIYETTYTLNESSIEINSPSRELVISDTTCAYQEKTDSTCQSFTGTFEKPLCIYIYDGKKVLKDFSNCSDLSHSE